MTLIHPQETQNPASNFLKNALTLLITGFFLLILDLAWLGWIGKPLYMDLEPLRLPTPYWPAATLFYFMYLVAIGRKAIFRATSDRSAFHKGCELGWIAYATYELTNWAVLKDWPTSVVLVDIAWGVFLTGITSTFGYRVRRWISR